MTVVELYLDEDCRHTCEQIRDRLRSDMGVSVSTSPVHRALQGVAYSQKKLRIEKITMIKAENKVKRKDFGEQLEKHMSVGDMIVFQDETNFSTYFSRNEGYARVGERAVVALTLSQGVNLDVQGSVSSGTGDPNTTLHLLHTDEALLRARQDSTQLHWHMTGALLQRPHQLKHWLTMARLPFSLK